MNDDEIKNLKEMADKMAQLLTLISWAESSHFARAAKILVKEYFEKFPKD